MDRNATLIADEGMRILVSNRVETNAPYFLASNDALWESWREIQAGRSNENSSEWVKSGWRIETRYLPNGGCVMSLHIRFDPTASWVRNEPE